MKKYLLLLLVLLSVGLSAQRAPTNKRAMRSGPIGTVKGTDASGDVDDIVPEVQMYIAGKQYPQGSLVNRDGVIWESLSATASDPEENSEWSPKNLGEQLGDEYVLPAAFTYTPPGSFYKDGKGKFKWEYEDHDAFRDAFRVDDFGGTGVEVCYIDPVSGDDANDGATWNTAYRTVNQALGLIGNTAKCRHISLAPGVYINDEGWDASITTTRPYSIYCLSGQATIGTFLADLTWTEQADKIYSAGVISAATNLGYVLDRTKKNEEGRFEPYALGSSTTDLKPGQYFLDGNTLYVKTSDGNEPSSLRNTLLTDKSKSFDPMGFNHDFYMEGITVYGQAIYAGTTRHAMLRCKFFYDKNDTEEDQIEVQQTGEFLFNDCVFEYSQSDMIDYRNDCTAVEWNCRMSYAGMTASVAPDQCSTAHLGAKIVRGGANSIYTNYRNSAFFDINAGTQSVNLGCNVGSEYPGAEAANTFAAVGGGDVAEIWLDAVKLAGKSQLYTSSATIHIRNLRLTAKDVILITNGGTISSF